MSATNRCVVALEEVHLGRCHLELVLEHRKDQNVIERCTWAVADDVRHLTDQWERNVLNLVARRPVCDYDHRRFNAQLHSNDHRTGHQAVGNHLSERPHTLVRRQHAAWRTHVEARQQIKVKQVTVSHIRHLYTPPTQYRYRKYLQRQELHCGQSASMQQSYSCLRQGISQQRRCQYPVSTPGVSSCNTGGTISKPWRKAKSKRPWKLRLSPVYILNNSVTNRNVREQFTAECWLRYE